jgi:hypothetical protein
MLASLPWRYILPVLGVLLALWGWGEHREGQGRAAERATWQAARAELLQLRTEKANWAAEKLAAKSQAIPQAGVKEINRVEIHWRDRPVRECLDADLVRSLEQARAAVRQSAAAGTSSDDVRTGADAATPRD